MNPLLQRIIRYTVLAAALVLIAEGIFREEHLAVWRKAVNICLECIGIG